MPEAKKVYTNPVIWYNSKDELIAAFGKPMGVLRDQMIEHGKAQAAKLEEMRVLAENTIKAKQAIPAGLAAKFIRARTGALGLTFDTPKETKAKSAKVAPGDFAALFGPDKQPKAA